VERESRETWAKRIERWQDSGLTAKEYAAEIGVNAHSLSWWRWHLSSSAAATPKIAPRPRRAKRASREASAPLTFVEFPTAAAVVDPFEVVLPSSVRVRVPSCFDAAALRRLLDALGVRT
jgi:transposase